jgi:hypothetical protein
VIAATIIVGSLHAQDGTRSEAVPSQPSPSPYIEVTDWPQLPPDVKLERSLSGVIGILPDDQGNVWILQRGKPAVMRVDKNGKLLKSFDVPLMYHAHGLCQDGDGNLWIGDQGLQGWPANGKTVNGPDSVGKGYVFHKFTQDGTLLQTIGQIGVSQIGTDTFVSPVACIVAPNGDIIIADGHIPRPVNENDGDRLLRFSKDGKFIRAYGKTGKLPGEFRGPHALAYDSQGRLFVADRQNNRIQIFDKNMKYVTEWKQFGRPSGLVVLKGDVLVVIDSESGQALAWADFPDQNVKLPRNPPFSDGVRIGSAKTGMVTLYFKPNNSSETISAASGGNTLYIGSRKYVKNP